MPFLYVYVCDLLEHLGQLYSHDCPTLVGLEKKTNDRTVQWFQRHRNHLNEFSVDARAVMMFFTPAKQTDRDYGLDTERLEQLIARVLGLSRNLHTELQMWRNGPSHGDLGACVKRVMEKTTSGIATGATTNKLSVEDIDQALLRIASHSPNSSSIVRSLASKVKNHDTIDLLGKLYRSLGAKEAKWLTRLILKSYGPIKFPEHLEFSSSMQFLPNCVRVNAEISISNAFPTLRDGVGLTKGTPPVGSNTKEASELTRAEISVHPLPTPPTTSPPKRARIFTKARVSCHPLPTPPTTAPHLLSSAAAPTPTHSAGVQSQPRQPLAALVLNSTPSQQSSGPRAYEPFSLMPSASTPKDAPLAIRRINLTSSSSYHGIPSHACCASSSHRSQPSLKGSHPVITNGTGTCILTTKLCPLTNCIFALAPCISSNPYITENLLSWHGSHTVTSFRSFSDPSFPRRCPRTGKKFRKIALVEINRTKQTQEFMQQIQNLNLRRSRGKKQWIEVYDWRILEAMAKQDRGKEYGYNPWRRNWVGAI